MSEEKLFEILGILKGFTDAVIPLSQSGCLSEEAIQDIEKGLRNIRSTLIAEHLAGEI